ncbi:MFS transporter [Actinosynnema sp. NPDC053489]|uniref:MFS transporter n=1 Tax=Actinosynnema sp. NPDC053489 TaxID=3363916 RepID=UPI0037CABE51
MRRLLPLVLGMAALGLDAYVVAGILEVVAGDLGVPVPVAGQLVTVFTLSYALLSPICAAFATGKPLRVVLLFALAVFTAGNALAALAPSWSLLLASRVVAGFGAGLYSPMAAATAAALVPEHRRGRALGLITAGLSGGTVAGMPLGLLLASHGWRLTYWLITALGVLAIATVAASVPSLRPAEQPPLRARVAVLADRAVVPLLLVTVLSTATSVGMYTYVASFLAEAADVGDPLWHLCAWGLGGLVGNLAIGALIDRWRDTRALLSVLLAVLGTSLALLPLAASGPGTIALMFLWGVGGWSCPAPQQHRLLALRPARGPVAISLNASSIYVGAAVGAAAGGALLAAGVGIARLPLLFGVVAVAAAVLNLLITPRPARQPTGGAAG